MFMKLHQKMSTKIHPKRELLVDNMASYKKFYPTKHSKRSGPVCIEGAGHLYFDVALVRSEWEQCTPTADLKKGH